MLVPITRITSARIRLWLAVSATLLLAAALELVAAPLTDNSAEKTTLGRELIGTWKALTTSFVENQGYSLVSAAGELVFTRDSSGQLVGSGEFVTKTKNVGYNTLIETAGKFTDCKLQYLYIPKSPGIIDDASEHRYRVSGEFVWRFPPVRVVTAQIFFTNQGFLALQPGGLVSGFDRIYFTRRNSK